MTNHPKSNPLRFKPGNNRSLRTNQLHLRALKCNTHRTARNWTDKNLSVFTVNGSMINKVFKATGTGQHRVEWPHNW